MLAFALGCSPPVAPELRLVAPEDGAILEGATEIVVEGRALERAVFLVDGAAIPPSDPLRARWAAEAINGNHRIEARGAGVGDAIEVWLAAADGLSPTAVRITWPPDGATVCAPLDVEVATTEEVVSTSIRLDGEPLEGSVPEGAHELEAVAVAADGRRARHVVDAVVASCDAGSLALLSPEPDAATNGSLEVAVTADGADRVRLEVDGVPLVELGPPFEHALDTSFLTEGAHSLGARTSSDYDFTSFYVDRTDPWLDVEPIGEWVAGVVEVAGTTDGAWVTLSVDGTLVAAAAGGAFSLSWDTSSLSPGARTLALGALDAAGNATTWTAEVRVDNPPSLSFLTPVDGDTVVPGALVELSVADDGDAVIVKAAGEGTSLGRATAPPWSWTWEICGLAAGPASLVATATDTHGQVTTAEIAVLVDLSDRDGDGFVPCDECDDADASVHPDAGETCGNGVDDDCDGGPSGCGLVGEVDSADADATLTGTTSSEGAGYALAIGDFDGDGAAELAIGAQGISIGGLFAGGAYVVDTPIEGESDLGVAATMIAGTERAGSAGSSLVAADLDGDGIDDLVIGANASYADGGAGALHVVAAPSGLVALDSDAAATWHDDTVRGQAGDSLGAGDADGDGVAELLVGGIGSRSGTAWYLADPMAGGYLDDATAIVTGDDNASIGSDVTMADTDGDGLDELVIGASNARLAGGSGGFALFAGPIEGDVDLGDADAARGSDSDGYAGYALAAGDIDGDGYEDILLGGIWDDEAGFNAGAAWLVLGPVTGEATLDTADAKLLGASGMAYAGYDVALGDVDADGAIELLVGSPYYADYGGAVYVVDGATRGTASLGDADAAVIGGSSEGIGAVLAAGDLDADGVDDLVVGAPNSEGRVLVFDGGSGM